MARREDVVWNRFAGIYDRFVAKDMAAYRALIGRIARRLRPDDRVLEVATGTGILALGLADHLRQMDAVDLAPEMIEKAKKKARESGISNVRFAVQDAYALSFASSSLDAVIIANALHIMPEPERALAEIQRVLAPQGVLIAPTFVHAGSRKAAVLSRLMSVSGFRAYHKWTEPGYHAFLAQNGFAVIESALLQASFPLAYAVALKERPWPDRRTNDSTSGAINA
jgi:ubiquinone/menaquinone biosynthesis C-methylase UbiE